MIYRRKYCWSSHCATAPRIAEIIDTINANLNGCLSGYDFLFFRASAFFVSSKNFLIPLALAESKALLKSSGVIILNKKRVGPTTQLFKYYILSTHDKYNVLA